LVKSYLNPKTVIHAEELIKSSMRFLDWSNPSDLIERSETYLKDGYPIKDAISINLEKLRDLKRVRNHIAHMSQESLSEYRKVLKKHFGTIPIKAPRPGEYLLMSSRSAITSYYLIEYIDLIETIGKQIT
jgi:hypothetical protein